MTFTSEDQITANTAAGLALDAVEAAGHGHPGTAVALAPVAQLLFRHHLRHDPTDPNWRGRDRFVLSCGHASMLLYAQLFLSGYSLTLDDIKNFRKNESLTPGHPEYGHTDGVEMTTGPLGQGLATAVGMAWAQLNLAARFDPDNSSSPLLSHVYVIASDGDLEEGVTSEAASFAGLHQIRNLTVIYDDNQISIDGDARASFAEDVVARYKSYGWDSLQIDLLDTGAIDINKLDEALTAARISDRPTLIALRTSIAYPSPNMTGMASTHGSPMGKDEVALTKSALGLNPAEFFQVPELAKQNAKVVKERAVLNREAYDKELAAFKMRQPVLAQEYESLWQLDLTSVQLPIFEVGSNLATRKASQQILESLSVLPQLIGGSADLSESNGVAVKSMPVYHGTAAEFGSVSGRRILFGIREHFMAAFNNGVSLASPLRPFSATFLIFADYMRPSIRLACLMNLPVTWVFSHDSIGLGEDGPTHQPVEQLWSLRAIPGIAVVRPADANETAMAWLEIIKRSAPAALVLTRQNLPTMHSNPDVAKGAYIVFEPNSKPKVIVIATGSEVQIALTAAAQLAETDFAIRVVSAPCLEWFDEQSDAYKNSLLAGSPKIAIEAGSTLGWWKYVGLDGAVLGVTNYGASATPEYLFNKFGLTTQNLINEIKKLA
jgi:transketolase